MLLYLEIWTNVLQEIYHPSSSQLPISQDEAEMGTRVTVTWTLVDSSHCDLDSSRLESL